MPLQYEGSVAFYIVQFGCINTDMNARKGGKTVMKAIKVKGVAKNITEAHLNASK